MPFRRAPVLSVFLTATLAVAWIAGAAHTLLVAHAVCAEHGESIHVSGRTSAPASGDAWSPAAPGEAHDHCKLAACARRISVPDRGFRVEWIVRGIAPLEGTGVAVTPAVPLFRLAPKNSPPMIG